MFMSLIMQSSIAVVAAVALEYLNLKSKPNKIGPQRHSQVLMIGIVEFQKNQSYFSGAIQLGTLGFAVQQFNNNGFPDLLDDGFLSTLSTNGLVPIVFTLSLITRHGRQS